MRFKIPLMPGTFNPRMNFSWDTRICMAAAVVKPDTRVSDRYTTMKPTCRRPMASCRKEWKAGLTKGFYSPNTDWHLTGTKKIPGKSQQGRSLMRLPGLSAHLSLLCFDRPYCPVPDGSPQPQSSGSGLGTILYMRLEQRF